MIASNLIAERQRMAARSRPLPPLRYDGVTMTAGASPLRAVLFDHDDTLVPTFAIRTRTWQQAVRDVLGVTIDGAYELRRYRGETVEVTALRQTGGDRALAERLVQHYRDRYYVVSAAHLTCFAGVPETLAELRRRGLRIAVVTSKIRRGAEQELRTCGVANLIDVIVGSEDVLAHKPDPEPLLHALHLLGCSPQEAVMIGDTEADLLAARATGTRAAAALWGAQAREELLALGPDDALESVSDVLRLVGG